MIHWNASGIPFDVWHIQERMRYSSIRHELKNTKRYPWYQRGMITCECSATLCPCVQKLELPNLTDTEIAWLKGEPLYEG
jgi:hypothetical protein